MDYVTRQEEARRFSRNLFVLFFAVVELVALAVYVLTILAMGGSNAILGEYDWWQPTVFAIVSVVTFLVIGIPTVLQMRELRRGGAGVARRLGGKVVLKPEEGSKKARLLNVVEEAAIAAGIATPAVFVLPNEPGVNAFAIGNGAEDAVIGVTQGALDAFNRAELAAVVSHELGHVLNGDSAINMKLLGATTGLEGFSVAGDWIWNTYHLVGWFALIGGIGLSAIGALGSGAAVLLRATLSREREFLADAHAVELTREPTALASALLKVHTDPRQGGLWTHRSALVSHLFLHRTTGRRAPPRLATHPPLVERIRRLDPSLEIPDVAAGHWRRDFRALKSRVQS